jgi:DNA repair exonuclease SbcCD ATPase subunit
MSYPHKIPAKGPCCPGCNNPHHKHRSTKNPEVEKLEKRIEELERALERTTIKMVAARNLAEELENKLDKLHAQGDWG